MVAEACVQLGYVLWASGKQQFNKNNKIISNNNTSKITTADGGDDSNGKDGNADKLQIKLAISHDILSQNELNTSSLAEDRSTDSDKEPPQILSP